MRKCFTINPNRSVEEIKSYEENLVKTNIYQGCEIFYPYLNYNIPFDKMQEKGFEHKITADLLSLR